MRKKTMLWFPALALLAAVGFAQNADQNSAGPTRNDLRLRVSEPLEGATINGSTVRVVVDYNRPIFGAGQGTHFGEATFPPAKFSVFIDGKLEQTLTAGESNVATIEDIAPGSHKLVVEARNVSGEIIDRSEIHFVTTAESAATNSAPAPVPNPAPAPVASTAPTTSYEPAPAASVAQTPSTLPQTGSPAPRLALAGLALMLSGFLVSRKVG